MALVLTVVLSAAVAACGGGVSGEVEPAGLAVPDRSTTEDPAEEDAIEGGVVATTVDAARQDLVEEGDRICADELGALTGLHPTRQIRGTIEQLRFIEQSYRRMATRLRAVPAPKADREVLELLFVRIEQVADAVLAMVDAIANLDEAAMDEANRQIDGHASDAERRLRDYGFVGCADA